MDLSLVALQAVSQKCAWEMAKLSQASVNPFLPADYAKMIAYSGQAINDLGNYDDCNKISIARYVLQGFNEYPVYTKAYCLPIVCSKSDLYILFGTTEAEANFEIFFPHLYQEENYRTYSSGAIVMITFISIIAFIGALSTLIEYFGSKESKKNKIINYLLCFSMISNTKRLLTARGQDRLGEKDTMEMLNAVRVMSIGWVILGHTSILPSQIGVLSNYQDIQDYLKDTLYIFVYGGFYAVDTFFWLSGFLMAYLFIIEIEKSRVLTYGKVALVYVHRYLRITPVYMFCLFFFWALQEYLGNGPIFFHISDFSKDCKKYWYTNLFYLNNMIPDGKGSGCLGVSWYLANDMQFFIFSPILILIYMKVRRELGWLLVLLFCFMDCLSSGLLANYYDLSPVIFSAKNKNNYMNYYYVKPYTRVVPYVLGIACGFIIYTYRQYKKNQTEYDKYALKIAKVLENKYIGVFAFFLGCGLINIILFCLHDDYKHPGSKSKYTNWSQTDNNMFMTFDRLTYGLGISLIFLSLMMGHLKPVCDFMSAYVWSVLARLTFVTYLIHYSIIEVIIKSQKNSYIYNNYNNFKDSFFYFFFSMLCSIPIVLLIEMPTGNIEKLIFAKPPVADNEKSMISLKGLKTNDP